MKELFNIYVFHEYDKGICPHIQLRPFPQLWEFEKNNRFRFRINNGSIQVFIEEDESPLQELEYVCFWLTYTHEDFIYYTELPKTESKNLLKWNPDKNKSGNRLLSINANGFDTEKQTSIPQNTLGVIQIPTALLIEQESIDFQLNFQSKKTYWEYHVYAPSTAINFKECEWSLKDVQKKWEFQLIAQENNKSIFRSAATLPFYSKAEKRISLTWHKKQNSFESKEFSKSIPFPNYQHQQLNNNEYTTITYINI